VGRVTKQELLQLNAVPEGKEPWLSYDQYVELKRLFGLLPSPFHDDLHADEAYARMHHFLTEVAQLEVSDDKAKIHFNTFVLIRRGYKVEEITQAEYDALRKLMDGIEQPDSDDMTLHETGSHRALYDYLRKGIGVSVEAGRGPAWHRAKQLMAAFERNKASKQN